VVVVAAVFSIHSDPKLITRIKNGYRSDPWCLGILDDLKRGMVDSKLNIVLKHGLLFIGQRLVIPKYKDLRERLFQLAHDNLGHFGAEKSYANLCNDFYWPNMRRDLARGYISGCMDCQRNKSSTSKTAGPLHPLPVPDKRFDSVAIDFIGPLPKDDGFDAIVTMTDRLGADIQIAACTTNITVEDFAFLFFDRWYCENGCPLEIISDHDKIFVSKFWRALIKLTGINHKLSTAYHPQMDGSSEQSNKTIVQCLHFHVERNQKGWVKPLPKVRFDIMNSPNRSTGVSPFVLKTGCSPRLLPPIVSPPTTTEAASEVPQEVEARAFMERMEEETNAARDNLVAAKIKQVHSVNKDRVPDPAFQVGDRVMLATAHRQRDYICAKDRHVAKFMPRFDGPYEVTQAFPESSLYRLKLPPLQKCILHSMSHNYVCTHPMMTNSSLPMRTTLRSH
jgi:Integrase zinc binding domain